MSNVKGLDKLLKQLNALPGEIQEEVEDITYGNAITLHSNAAQAAPVNKRKHVGGFPNLKQSGKVFNFTTDKEVRFKVAFLKKYAAYMEFGTGGLVNVPPELKELAFKFLGKGIREVNLEPQPFLYPALVRQRPLWIKELKRMLKDRTSKI